MRRQAGLTIVEALIVFAVLCGLWCLLPPDRLLKAKRPGHSNLRRLGLSATLYGDGTRFYPHVRADGTPYVPDGLDDDRDDLALWRVEAPCGLLALLLVAVLVTTQRGPVTVAP